LIVIL